MPFRDDCTESPLDDLLFALPRLTEPQLTELHRAISTEQIRRSLTRTAEAAGQRALAFKAARDQDERLRRVGASRGRST